MVNTLNWMDPFVFSSQDPGYGTWALYSVLRTPCSILPLRTAAKASLPNHRAKRARLHSSPVSLALWQTHHSWSRPVMFCPVLSCSVLSCPALRCAAHERISSFAAGLDRASSSSRQKPRAHCDEAQFCSFRSCSPSAPLYLGPHRCKLLVPAPAISPAAAKPWKHYTDRQRGVKRTSNALTTTIVSHLAIALDTISTSLMQTRRFDCCPSPPLC
ncbi:hypothetical protein V8C35DRAFT_182285 [Trichoderma chlorosporum]